MTYLSNYRVWTVNSKVITMAHSSLGWNTLAHPIHWFQINNSKKCSSFMDNRKSDLLSSINCLLQLQTLSFKGPIFMATLFKRTITAFMNIFQWHGMCFQTDYCHKLDHFKMWTALMALLFIFPPWIAQVYIINVIYAHICANILHCYIQVPSWETCLLLPTFLSVCLLLISWIKICC